MDLRPLHLSSFLDVCLVDCFDVDPVEAIDAGDALDVVEEQLVVLESCGMSTTAPCYHVNRH